MQVNSMELVFFQRIDGELVLLCGTPEAEDEIIVPVMLPETEPELLAA